MEVNVWDRNRRIEIKDWVNREAFAFDNLRRLSWGIKTPQHPIIFNFILYRHELKQKHHSFIHFGGDEIRHCPHTTLPPFKVSILIDILSTFLINSRNSFYLLYFLQFRVTNYCCRKSILYSSFLLFLLSI